MQSAHASPRCSAKSKRSGERCGAPGSAEPVCLSHARSSGWRAKGERSMDGTSMACSRTRCLRNGGISQNSSERPKRCAIAFGTAVERHC